mgnify:CR=1 FL=1
MLIHLDNEYFELIKSGTKNIELRLNDEKRRKLKVNDIIEFENRKNQEKIYCRIVKLHYEENFETLYKYFEDNGISNEQLGNITYTQLEKFYSKEEQQKYGVVGIELKNIKEIVYNPDNIDESSISRIVKRAKILLINDRDEVLICNSKHNYFLLGGHVEGEEPDESCLLRELDEEAGINIDLKDMQFFMSIKYLSKDYPEEGINSMSLANYYYLRSNVLPSLKDTHLTKEEEQGNFRIEQISIEEIVDILTNSLDSATRKVVVVDTIEVLKEYIKENL